MRDNDKPSQYRYKNKNRISKKSRHKGTKNLSAQDAIKLKLKQIFLPYLCLSILTILLFNAFRWVFDIYLDVLPLKEGYWNFGIPCFLSALVVSIWMWPRYELLTLKWVKRSSSSYFFITMVLALVVPLVLSQNYLSKAAYKVIEVNNLNDIRHYPKQKYFSVSDFEPLKSEQVSYIETQVISGRYFDSTLHIDYYIATPFIAAENIWLGSSYHTSYDNREDQSIKDSQYAAFINDSRHNYEAKDFSNIRYFNKLKSSNSMPRLIAKYIIPACTKSDVTTRQYLPACSASVVNPPTLFTCLDKGIMISIPINMVSINAPIQVSINTNVTGRFLLLLKKAARLFDRSLTGARFFTCFCFLMGIRFRVSFFS